MIGRRVLRNSGFLVLALVGAAACTEVTEPRLPSGSVEFSPPPVYQLWWSMTAACSGHSGSLDAVTWYVVPGAYELPGYPHVAGEWFSLGNRIVLAQGFQMEGSTVRHEMLHALYRGTGHPRSEFLEHCGGVVGCEGECVRDAGPPPRADPATPLVPSDSIDIGLAFDPPVPSSSEYGGYFTMTVTARNPAAHSVSVVPRPSGDAGPPAGFRYRLTFLNGGLSYDDRIWDSEVTLFRPGEVKREVFDFVVRPPNASSIALAPGSYRAEGAYNDHWGTRVTLPWCRDEDFLLPGRKVPMLHVLNGDSPASTFRRSSVPGEVVVWPDVLYEGPVPLDADDATWRTVRARFLADAYRLPYDETLHGYETADGKLARFAEYGEVVLWFEHDLYDQLLLARHLDWFGRQTLKNTALSLICIGAYPGVERFSGLGQLSAEQLAPLLETRHVVTVPETQLGRAAWRAFAGDDPTRLEWLLAGDTSALPFLGGAIRRHLEEFPATTSGLPRTERQILAVLAREPLHAGPLFRETQTLEESIFMGDWSFWRRVRALASGTQPLVTLDGIDEKGAGLSRDAAIAITDDGRAVLAGRKDWIALAGFDRWLGGVHLAADPGGRVAWRWDGDERQLRADPRGAA